jgi:hypothetical protein
MDLRELRWSDIDWIHLAQDRGQWRALVNMSCSIKCWEMFESPAQLTGSKEGLSCFHQPAPPRVVSLLQVSLSKLGVQLCSLRYF